MQNHLLKLLKQKEISAHKAISSQDSSELLNKENYDLLFCDTSLAVGPYGNKYGLNVAVLFKQKNPNGIIIGNSVDDSFRQDWSDIADEFYKKPFSCETIEAILRKYF